MAVAQAQTASNPKALNVAANAIRPDNLLPIPGMLVAVVNVTGAEMKGDPLALDVPYLRYAWKDRAATLELLEKIEKAVKAERTVGQMRQSVAAGLKGAKNGAGWIEFLPKVVEDRVVGLKEKKP